MKKTKFKAYRQINNSECGLTCVRMIARHYGEEITSANLRKLTEVNKQGVSIEDIKELLSVVGLNSVAIKITASDAMSMPLPAIIYWKQCHFVVLYHIDIRKNLYYIADPAEGKLILTKTEFESYWKDESESGIVILAEPTDNFQHLSYSNPSFFNSLKSIIKENTFSNRKDFIIIISLMLICMVADLAMPLILQTTVDEGIGKRDIGLVWLFMASQLAIFIGNSFASNILQYVIVKLGQKINIDLTGKYLKKLISLPLRFFDSKSSAELIQKIDDQSRIKDFIIQLPNSTIFLALNLIVFSGLLIWYNPYLFIFFISMTLIESVWTIYFLPKRKLLDYKFFDKQAENRNYTYEIINGITEIKTTSSQHSKLRKWEDIQKNLMELTMKSSLLTQLISGGQNLIARLKEIICTGICATLVIKGMMSFGEMLTVSYIIGRLSSPYSNIIGMISNFQDTSISCERLEDVLCEESCSAGTDDLVNPTIKFKNVGFRYSGSASPFIIKNLDLEIPYGKTIAIVGESGCGKSTLIKLMMGLYTPQIGDLFLSGKNIKNINPDAWLKKCGVVMQSGYIFSDSILNNITLENVKSNHIQYIEEISRTVGLHEFISSLPMGYNTKIGTTGIELSGGQKQRLLIARALYKQPEILFLDEATSSLDALNERRITEGVQNFQKGKTLIIAAHRLSTIKNADVILYMENGKIIEKGAHAELLRQRGKYYHLVSNQLELIQIAT